MTITQDALVKQVASVNNNTIVVVNTVGAIVVEAWIDNPNGMVVWLSSLFSWLIVLA